MLSFADLRDAKVTPLHEAADGWGRLARRVDALGRLASAEISRPLHASGWRGQVADAAFGRIDVLDDELELTTLRVRTIGVLLGGAATRFTGLQSRLHTLIAEATGHGLRVDDDGRVHLPPEPQADLRAYADECASDIARIVAEAGRLDGEVHNLLRRFGSSGGEVPDPGEWGGNNESFRKTVDSSRELAALFGVTEEAIPAPSGDPAGNAAWWHGLTEEQRSLYLAAYPGRVGALDGLPATARDEANRLALRDHIGDLEIQPTGGWQRDLNRSRALLARLEASEYGPPNQRMYLLAVEHTADGRAVVAVGNPDTARHAAVVVPGITNTLDDVGDDIDRAVNLQQAADDLTTDGYGDVAVVAWLGYDTPGLDASALRDAHARAGAEPLDRFVDGIRAAQGPEHRHLTVVGHSYGSTVVGEAAARGDGLAADDLVVAGSPGMHVQDVHGLNKDPRHVWAGAAQGDDVTSWMSRFAHGPEPHRESFGANRYHVDTHGHGGYWDPSTESLRNQARIVVGFYDQVSLDHGQAPR